MIIIIDSPVLTHYVPFKSHEIQIKKELDPIKSPQILWST